MQNEPQPAAAPLQADHHQPPRRYTLAAMLAVVVLLFVALHFLNQAFGAHRRRIAHEQYARGVEAMSAGRPTDAVERFFNALRFSPGDHASQLKLAQALAASGRLQQAQAYLSTLLEEEPGDGMANLELARLAVREHDLARATRYFNAAIYGAWPQDGQKMRLAVRFELVRALLQEKQAMAARSELIGLMGDLPDDPAMLAEAGGLLFDANDNRNALALLRRAMAKQKPTAEWLRIAGLAAFRGGDYPAAAEYLRQAVERGAGGDAANTLAVARAVLALDPYARGVRHSEHAARVYRAWQVATARARQCALDPAGDPGRQRAELEPRVSQRRLLRDPELLDSVTEAVFRVEQATEACPARTPEDSALALLAQRYAGQGR